MQVLTVIMIFIAANFMMHALKITAGFMPIIMILAGSMQRKLNHLRKTGLSADASDSCYGNDKTSWF